MLIIGIDPGKEGALCFMHPGGIHFEDMPTVKASKGNRRNYDLGACRDLLMAWTRILKPHIIALETFHPMPKQSVQSIWSQSRGITIWEAMAVALGLPLTTYLPQGWKNAIIPGDRKKDKDGAYWTACNLYPWIRPALKTPRGRLLDGHCDALCIAEHCRREQGGPFMPVEGGVANPVEEAEMEGRMEASMHSHHGGAF